MDQTWSLSSCGRTPDRTSATARPCTGPRAATSSGQGGRCGDARTAARSRRRRGRGVRPGQRHRPHQGPRLMERPITEEEFDRLLATPARSAFRLETRAEYSLGYEQIDFDQWLDGHPTPPPDLDWWRPWLEQIKRLTGEGRQISRVRVLAEPLTDYQRWEMWAAPWHAR